MGGLALCKAAKGALVLSRLNVNLNSLTDGSLLAMADALRFNAGEAGGAHMRGGEESPGPDRQNPYCHPNPTP